jgi:diguanylate cyclase (GGDEF)-like protein/PAS domain S-box-containing protein
MPHNQTKMAVGTEIDAGREPSVASPTGDAKSPSSVAFQTVDAGVLRRLASVSAEISQGRPLMETLQAVADGVVAALGFGVAAVNFVQPDGDLHISAIAGPSEAREALLGKTVPRQAVDDLIARSQPWGALRFVPHGQPTLGQPFEWVADVVPTTDPEAWHPEDALFGPMYGSDGELVGLLSVDLPPGLRRPAPLLCELLEIFTVQAGIAIENARLIEELRRERDRLAASEKAFRFFFTGSAGAMCTVSLDEANLGRILRANRALGRLLGYSIDELLQLRLDDLLVGEDRPGGGADALFGRGPRGDVRVDRQMVCRDGSTVWTCLTGAQIVLDAASAPVLLLHVDDISARKTLEASLSEMAKRDPLTGLPNRRAFLDYLRAMMGETGRGAGGGAVIYADLDGFKRVNDRFGHSAGDEVLKAAAHRLAAHFRDSDVVARLGGDEFAIVAPDLDRRQAGGLIARVRSAFAEPMPGMPDGSAITVSLGVSYLDPVRPEARTAEEILHQADQAMYADKRMQRLSTKTG